MTITAWRIAKARYAASAFSGDGAKEFGGRWNSPGVPVVYASGSRSLALLEILVHTESPELLSAAYVLFEIRFNAALVTRVTRSQLPRSWRKSPPSATVQRIGDDWIRAARSVVLAVPSVIIPDESNYLINPAHRDFAKLRIGPKRAIQLDDRLRH